MDLRRCLLFLHHCSCSLCTRALSSVRSYLDSIGGVLLRPSVLSCVHHICSLVPDGAALRRVQTFDKLPEVVGHVKWGLLTRGCRMKNRKKLCIDRTHTWRVLGNGSKFKAFALLYRQPKQGVASTMARILSIFCCRDSRKHGTIEGFP